MAENTNTALLTTLERMANHAESHRETTSHSYQALQRAYEEDRNAVDAVAKMIAEREALAAEVKALREDAKRLDWLDSQEADVRFHRDHELAGDGEYLIMVQIVNGDKSISGHPLGYVRDAIDAARASAATGGGNG